MSILLQCKCGHQTLVRNDRVGTSVECPSCGAWIDLPADLPPLPPPAVPTPETDTWTCPYCGAMGLHLLATTCPACRRALPSPYADGGVRQRAFPGEDRAANAVGAGIMRWLWRRFLPVAAGVLLAVWVLLWFTVIAPNRRRIEAVEEEDRTLCEGRGLKGVDVDCPFAPLSMPDELEVSAILKSYRRSSQKGLGSVKAVELKGKYDLRTGVLRLRSAEDEDEAIAIWISK